MSAQPGAPPYLFAQAGTFDGPFVFNVPASLEVQPTAATATFDGAGASGDFIACLSFYAQSGELLSRVYPQTPVTAGDVAQISYAPFPGGLAGGGGGSGLPTGWTEDGSDPANVNTHGGSLDMSDGRLTVEDGTTTITIGGNEIDIADSSTGEEFTVSPGSDPFVSVIPAAGSAGYGVNDLLGAAAAMDAGSLKIVHLAPGTAPTDAVNVSQLTPYAQDTIDWEPTFQIGSHAITDASIIADATDFGSPPQEFVQGLLEIVLGTDTGSGDGDRYFIDLPTLIGQRGVIGWGICEDVSAGVAYPAYFASTSTGHNAVFLTTGTTPGGGETTPWAIRPDFPFTFAEGDAVFRGSFLYLKPAPQ